jgi:hypothetical protein
MPFHAIRGHFFCVNYSPDGDTVRFKPDDLGDLDFLDGVPPAVNGRGHVAIRFEAIDALETHFERRHQPLALANAARNAVLDKLGIQDVVWDQNAGSVVSARDGVRGYIVARATDKFGRVIAFVFTGDAPQSVEEPLFLDAGNLDGSLNAALLREGLAYPTYYWTLFADLRAYLTKTVVAARQARLGVHAVDRTNLPTKITSIGSLTDDALILPKLFRRASVYVANAGTIAGFKVALAQNREPVLDLRDNNFTHFDTFVEERDSELWLTRLPEELVFDPMPDRPGGEFTVMMNGEAGF